MTSKTQLSIGFSEDCGHWRNSKRARMTVEAFKQGYRVGEDGRIVSKTGRVMRGRVNGRGYVEFSMRLHKKQTCVVAHQLSAFQKFGYKAFGAKIQVRHLDGNPTNNRPSNLELGTARQNSMDRPRALRVAQAKKAAAARKKLTDDQVRDLRAKVASGRALVLVAKEFGISKSTASYIVNRKTYKDVE